MAWVAVGVGVAGVIGGAYSANRQAKAANKKQTTQTNQTTTQDPYKAGLLEPDINDVLWHMRGNMNRGVPQLDANGNLVYANRDNLAAETPRQGTIGGSGGAGSGGGSGARPNQPTAGMRYNKAGKLVPVKNVGSGATVAAGGTLAPKGPDLSSPQGIFSEVARRGLDAGTSPLQTQARTAAGNILGAAGSGAGGSAGAGEQTGFEGYNPVLGRLAMRLEGDADDRVGRELLLGFLDENERGGGYGSGSGSGAGANGSGGSFAYVQRGYAPGTGGAPAPMQYGGPDGPGSGVPDTMATDSFFGTGIRDLMNEGANDAELQALIDAMNADTERAMFRDMAQLDAAATGAGRFGGDMWKGMTNDSRRAALDAMNKSSAQVRVGDREARRQAILNALGQVNQRDLGLLGANVSREGIAAGERAANAASSASAGAAADQLALARRGQDLSAIGSLLDYEKFGLGELGEVGGQLSSDRLSTIGMVPGLEGIGLEGLNLALGAGGGMTDLRGQSINAGIARGAQNLQRLGLNQQASIFNAGQAQDQVNSYLATILGIGGMGGTSHTEGTNVQPGLGVSPSAAGWMGAAGGAATGLGLYNQWRANQPAPTYNPQAANNAASAAAMRNRIYA